MDTPESIPPEVYDSLLIAEAAGKLPPEPQQALNTLRQAGAVPEIQWQPDHPHIQAAEQQYGLPKGFLSALLPVENGGTKQYAPGSNDATSPTAVKGLFQVTLGTGAKYGLTPDNRTNPYVETDVAAQLAKDLLAQNGNSIKGALHAYKGQGPLDAPDSVYFDKFAKNFQRYGGDPNLLKDRADAGYKPVNLGFEPQAPAGSDPNLVREDGTLKGHGWLGDLQTPDGRVASEISISVPIHGHETLIPQLVPTLAPDEVNLLVGGGKPTPAMTQKAIAFAKQRIAAGKSPFAQPGEYGGNAQGVQERFAALPEASVGTSTTTTPATQTVGQEIRQRAGFGTPQAPEGGYGNGPLGVLGQALSNLGAGPMGPLLKMLEVPAATVGTGIDRATGSSTAGTVGQVLTDVLGPKLLTGAGSRLIAPVLPREMARSFVPRAAARLDLRDASRLTPGLENTVSNATTRAEQLAQQAEAATAQAGTHATTAADLKSQAAAAAATPPTLPSALTTAHQQALQNAGHDLLAVGVQAQTDTAQALPRWRKAAGALLDQAEDIPGAALTMPGSRRVLTDAGRVVIGDNGVAVDLTKLGLPSDVQDLVRKSFDQTLTLKEARQVESALGRAGAGKMIGTPEEGARRLLYSTVKRDIHDYMMTPAENAGGSDAVAALQNAKDNYRRGVLLFNDAAKRLVTGARNAPKASESVIDTVFRPDHFTDLMDFKQLVEPETYQAATETWYNQLVRRASAGPKGLTAASYEAELRPYLVNNHLEQILPPAQAQQIRSTLSQALDAAGQPKRAAAVLQGQAMQAKQAAQATTAQAKTLKAGAATANQQAVGATRQIKQLARQSEQATKVLAAPTKTRRLLRAGGAVIKPIAYGAGVGAGGAAAYRAFNSK